ncbi:MAG: endonuclease MutS2 [Tissierellia bacterium]|nr:endonuclease MutS2 [Tissierellia bacterium]
MDNKAFITLEYNRIIDKLKDYCQSSLGQAAVSSIVPLDDLDTINDLLEQNADAIELIVKYSNPPLYGISDLKSIVKRLNMGGILENYQFRQIADSLRVSQALKDYVSEMEQENLIKDRIALLYTNKRVESEIDRIILDDEKIADDASRTLFNLRRNIRNKTEDIRKKLNSIVQDKDSQIKLQENIITIREGRYVVPVKAASKSHFPGIAHDRSSSGQTVYIEPMVVVELNNEIRQLQIEEHDEIRKILRELSELCAQYSEEIETNQDLLVQLDVVFSKAKMALDMRATRPILNDEKIVDIKDARHPLLTGKVVPIDIKIGDGYRALIITGPNTGGKTVSLKTLGLMILMSQSGLFIPAAEFSKVGIFKSIYADIGDKQSIELSLSTFSASMTNIVSILEVADENSLVLFDELGSGTDPTEGAALAMSIIDYLIKKNTTVVSTTHYSELKLYAMTTDYVQNASVEFDVKTLSPTFRLIIGTPGKSNAFEISKRLGLVQSVLDNASKYISKENRDFESLISEIESDRIEAEKKVAELDRLKQEYLALNQKLKASVDDKKEAAQRQVEESKEQARRILDEAREEAKSLIKQAKKSIGNSANLDRSYTEITDKYKDFQDKYARKEKNKVVSNKNIEVTLGESVRIISMDDVGVVQTLPDSKGDLIIQVGILKFNSNISDIEKVQEKETKKDKSSSTYRKVYREKSSEDYKTSLDLRGQNINESINEIEKFFDNSIIIGLKEVSIIHGKGTGALRKGITDYLKKSRYVDTFRIGTLKEGGAGVTVVTLK